MSQPVTFGAEPNPTGDPVGGGKGYRRIVTHGTKEVSTVTELLEALDTAVAGDVVYIRSGTTLNLTGKRKIQIPQGVTLAGDRGREGSLGPMLYSDDIEDTPENKSYTFCLFLVTGEGVRITGIRLRGPDPNIGASAYARSNSEGIKSHHPNLEIDNCEISQWSHAGVFLTTGSIARIHHNEIHHCRRNGLGYGVCLDKASAIIEANRFDWNRHSIAGTGRSGTSYVARYNVVLGNANSHCFDMHGRADRDKPSHPDTDIADAGDTIRIHHNTFHADNVAAIKLRGVPTTGAWVHHNWFSQVYAPMAVVQTNAFGSVHVDANIFGRHMLTPCGKHAIDWKAETGNFRLWRFQPNTPDPLVGPVQHGNWGTVRSGHSIIPIGNYVIDWAAHDGSYRLWRFDPESFDPLPGPPIQEGSWATIRSGHVLIPIQGFVLDWVPLDGGYRVWRFNPESSDPLPGPPIQEGSWTTIRSGHVLVPFGSHILDWQPETGDYALWRFDPTTADPLPTATQKGRWNTMPLGHVLIPIGIHAIDWVPKNGGYRLWEFKPESADPLPAPPAQAGTWATIQNN